jgi:quercetin dioxygenase-like cupin family protein
MHTELKQFGSLYGTLYSFDETGDLLPMHNHNENTVHVTFIMDGSFQVRGSTWEMEAKAGKFIDWQPGQAHEFVALEPNSRFLNIVKGI